MRYYSSVLLLFIAITVLAEPPDDKLSQIPGYPPNFKNRAYAGYLNTQSDQRNLHYIFLQGNKGENNDAPVVLWMNGGPGCTSKIGFLQQISPYCLNDTQPYTSSTDMLTFNPWSWINLTNLLFIDGPAGVGYSINEDPNFVYNDANTARDNLFALKYFFTEKFPQYRPNTFYIAGQSYAGKFIPDLAVRIISDNAQNPQTPIRLKGILVGNGVMNWLDLEFSRVQFMISHNFVDPKLIPYWQRSCLADTDSAGCRFFYERYEDLTYRIDEYNIYGDCYGRPGPPERSLMAQLSLRFSPFRSHSKRYNNQRGGLLRDWCSYDKGVQNYLNINKKALRSNKEQDITECNMAIFNNYTVNLAGSIAELRTLIGLGLKIYLYNGDWDDVVPFTDNIKNINRLGLRQQGGSVAWKIGTQHAGFIRNFTSLQFYLVKGAGQEVPLYQRERSYRMFEKFVA